MKVFAFDTINVTQKSEFLLGREENIMGKKTENAGYLFTQCFQKLSFQGSLKLRLCVNPLPDNRF